MSRSRAESGFTLLEMIVAIGIFLIALIIILGALVAINNAARKARSARAVTDNLSTAIDSISRSIRVGSNFHCGCGGSGDPTSTTTPQNCTMTDTTGSGGNTCLAFEGQLGDPGNNNDQIIYRLYNGSIQRSTNSGASYLPLTAPELSIESFRFYLYGTAPNEDQPVVTMVLRGSVSATARTATSFNMQTTVSAYTPSFTITP
jgi:prepilin-type N-terminal cleavage/methylation domain-containing protein